MNIRNIHALEVFDSRGKPTLKTYVELEDGTIGSAMVPSGASTGTHEALELRDKDINRYIGEGVLKALDNVNVKIAMDLKGKSINDLEELDKRMIQLDGTPNKKNLGANAILSVSLASARAYANFLHKPLWRMLNEFYFSTNSPQYPFPMINIINGGKHANWNLDFQEYLIVPMMKDMIECLRAGSEIFYTLKKKLIENELPVAVGDEGGFAPQLASNEEAFQYLSEAITLAGYTTDEVKLATDVAASEFYLDGTYQFKRDKVTKNSEEMHEYYVSLTEKYPIYSFEDPFHEDDFSSFALLTEKIGSSHLIIGDDIYVTNTERIKKGIESRATNAVLVKVNQVGTLLETVSAIQLARQMKWKVVISHRSGETEDPFIADLAVACGADFIKTGSMSRSERLAKYNRLIEIYNREV